MADRPLVADASVVLAILQDEPGGAMLPRGVIPRISAVNLLEVSIVLARHGFTPRRARQALDAMAFTVVPFDDELIESATTIHQKARAKGISLGDAACLATARACGGVAWTADQAWRSIDAGVEIHLIR